MDLQVRGVNLQPTPTLVEHANRRFGFALDRLSHRVRSVLVKMSEPNGGGMMRCDVQVHLAGGSQPIIVEQSGSDLYGAIDRAADRVQTCVRRFTQKTRQHR